MTARNGSHLINNFSAVLYVRKTSHRPAPRIDNKTTWRLIRLNRIAQKPRSKTGLPYLRSVRNFPSGAATFF